MAAPSATTTAAIASGTSLSSPIDLSKGALVYMLTPSAWTAADLTFQISEDNITFYDLFDNAGFELKRTITPGVAVLVDTKWTEAAMWIKLRSGSRVKPINQAADRPFTLMLL